MICRGSEVWSDSHRDLQAKAGGQGPYYTPHPGRCWALHGAPQTNDVHSISEESGRGHDISHQVDASKSWAGLSLHHQFPHLSTTQGPLLKAACFSRRSMWTREYKQPSVYTGVTAAWRQGGKLQAVYWGCLFTKLSSLAQEVPECSSAFLTFQPLQSQGKTLTWQQPTFGKCGLIFY